MTIGAPVRKRVAYLNVLHTLLGASSDYQHMQLHFATNGGRGEGELVTIKLAVPWLGMMVIILAL